MEVCTTLPCISTHARAVSTMDLNFLLGGKEGDESLPDRCWGRSALRSLLGGRCTDAMTSKKHYLTFLSSESVYQSLPLPGALESRQTFMTNFNYVPLLGCSPQQSFLRKYGPSTKSQIPYINSIYPAVSLTQADDLPIGKLECQCINPQASNQANSLYL